MTKTFTWLVTLITTLLPTAAFAYVGPGAGLSLLGALWALIAAIATALLFVILWPLRRALRRKRTQREARTERAEPVMHSSDDANVRRSR